MNRFLPRAGRWPLACLLAALGACADAPLSTAPRSAPSLDLVAGAVVTVTSTSGGTGAGSLPWAVAQAAAGDTIRFDPRLAGATITLDSTLVIRRHLTIDGPQDRGVTISGGGKGRVIDVAFGYTQGDPAVKLRNLSITGGKLVAEDNGAGIRTAVSLVLEHATVSGNEAPESPAIHVLPAAYEVTIFNSTVSGNVSSRYAYPAIKADAKVILAHSTVAHNSHGGIDVGLGSLTLRQSIVANNGARNCRTGGYVGYYGPSVSNDSTCGSGFDMIIGDVKLRPLADNGGPGMTHALDALSAALNVAGTGCGPVDQRYAPRGTNCDLGAYESPDAVTVAFTVDPGATADPTTGVIRLAGTMQCARLAQFHMTVQLAQRSGTGSGEALYLTCDGTVRRWIADIVPASGAFRQGAGTVTFTPRQGPSWLAPATTSVSTKLARARG